MKLRCLIIDDEQLALDEMRHLLSAHPDVEVVGEAMRVADALEVFQREKPALVFLDIQLREETGFDFVGRLQEPWPRLVFVTAHDRFAIRAFECNALDYLLKPVHPERLGETLRRIRAAPRLPPAAQPEDCVFVKMNATARFLPWKDILSIKSEGNYTRLFLADGSAPLMLRTLKEWQKLAPPGQFLQAHRSALVHGRAIRELRSTADGRHVLVTADKREIPIGRAFWPKVKAAFMPTERTAAAVGH